MRGVILVALGAVVLSPPLLAAQRDLIAERQAFLASLATDPIATIEQDRAICASGKQPAVIAKNRSLGAVNLPDAADYCMVVLHRLASEGKLGPIRDSRTASPTPAIAIDTGFAAGYSAKIASLGSLPTMVALRPIAERCLRQVEPNIRLCYSAGYAFGARMAQGETVLVR